MPETKVCAKCQTATRKNVRTACKGCNLRKYNKMPEVANVRTVEH